MAYDGKHHQPPGFSFGKYRPRIRAYEKGDVSDNPSVALRMMKLVEMGRKIWVLILPYPSPKVLACHVKRRKLMSAPEAVAKNQMTFNQWVAAVEAASLMEIENAAPAAQQGEE